ncbi:hypothetical protein KQH61_05975 [bacterium]|nr:hypothetical protein [bacterium]
MARHWIIGNGPSLNDTPLDLLEGEITWAMNRIHYLYDRVKWRPTYFFMIDHNSNNPKGYWKDCLMAHYNTPKYLWRAFRDGLPKSHPNHEDIPEGIGELPNTTWIDRCEKHHYYMANNITKRAESWHLPELCTAFTGLAVMIQLAVLNGADEIYLLGCDVGYSPDYTKNFFDPNYTDDMRDRAELDNTNMTWAHEVARRSSPVPIYNATIGGSLEVHPRVDLMEVLKNG